MSEKHPKIRILILEDDADTAMLIGDTLADYFGPECATIISTLNETREIPLDEYNMVLCDYHLPDGTGLTALRIFLSRRSDLPVVMVTSERETTTVVDAIRTGAYDYVIKSDQMFDLIPLTIEKNLEVFRIKRENHRLQEDLRSSFKQIQDSNARLADMVLRLEEMAHTDALTGLFNRRHLTNTLGQMFAEAKRYRTDLACVMIDLDGFKKINDTFGHHRGDEALMHLGKIIRENIRDADVAVRFGGDEFVILMPQTDGQTAAAFVQRICRQFDRSDHTQSSMSIAESPREHSTPKFTFSVGIACVVTNQPADGEQLVSQADQALYAAKAAGRNCIMLFQPDGGGFTKMNSDHQRRASA